MPVELYGPVPGRTPVLHAVVSHRGRTTNLWLKLEQENPFGSIKDRVAYSLLSSIFKADLPCARIIESTSGNLGVALARYAQICGVAFTAVVDPRTSRKLVRQMRCADAEIVEVTEPDETGGYLLARLAYIRDRLAVEDRLVWPNQYENPANPQAHFAGTAPEIFSAVPVGELDVFLGVSTGGTVRGFTDYVRHKGLPWRCVAVDELGSTALGGLSAPRSLNGIGASRNSSFVTGQDCPSMRVTAAEAVAACDWVADELGVRVGSSGAAVAGALRWLRDGLGARDMAVVCPDGGDRYEDTIYSPVWRRAKSLTAQSNAEFPKVHSVQFVDNSLVLV
ncbi:pyridoxal-phosphate dependent enzyme [Amycolatopsis sp. PS_44_ISF1]|uniref:pyridoxal-phosphate dependent enzyme n=1 Tax=Amycolatopsis sp. PS_44_ISF1 TaxID=2974917 RepID=UPI0028DF0A40|nr:pyridoxal-phosphate dependent enzyme [Amycolatopsis sp. PS_44_ISF1]MDT8915997.1 pyridoxal-phosphate dependent enzyme [Amycolatopsis sp. PS_44_ISF1]